MTRRGEFLLSHASCNFTDISAICSVFKNFSALEMERISKQSEESFLRHGTLDGYGSKVRAFVIYFNFFFPPENPTNPTPFPITPLKAARVLEKLNQGHEKALKEGKIGPNISPVAGSIHHYPMIMVRLKSMRHQAR